MKLEDTTSRDLIRPFLGLKPDNFSRVDKASSRKRGPRLPPDAEAPWERPLMHASTQDADRWPATLRTTQLPRPRCVRGGDEPRPSASLEASALHHPAGIAGMHG